jgi:hypothetical protein
VSFLLVHKHVDPIVCIEYEWGACLSVGIGGTTVGLQSRAFFS